MSFILVKTIDDKNLWMNLAQVSAFSYSEEEHICLIEISGGEPHQISMEEFSRVEPFLTAHQEKLHAGKK